MMRMLINKKKDGKANQSISAFSFGFMIHKLKVTID